MSVQQEFEVQDESLLADECRNTGVLKRRLGYLKAPTKSTSTPKYVFTATCNGIPQELDIGTRLEFEVIIHPQHQSNTSKIEPEITLDSCTMTLIAQISGPHPTHIEILQQRHRTHRPSGPFSKTTGYRKIIDLGILSHVPSTFNFADVSHSHKLRLELQFHAANNTVVMKRECPVIFKHLSGPDASALMRADSGTASLLEDGLPTYDEAVGEGRDTDPSPRQ